MNLRVHEESSLHHLSSFAIDLEEKNYPQLIELKNYLYFCSRKLKRIKKKIFERLKNYFSSKCKNFKFFNELFFAYF